jgi:hypothetical protein
MEPEFSLECAIVLQSGIAIAEHFDPFVAALEVELGTSLAVPAIQAHLYDAKLDPATVPIELNIAGTEHVNIVGILSLDLDDPPTVEYFGRIGGRRAALARSLGRRTRL